MYEVLSNVAPPNAKIAGVAVYTATPAPRRQKQEGKTQIYIDIHRYIYM